MHFRAAWSAKDVGAWAVGLLIGGAARAGRQANLLETFKTGKSCIKSAGIPKMDRSEYPRLVR
jgi:hypothetical protein